VTDQLAGVPLAHAAHWFAAVLYVAPVVVVVIALWVSSRRAQHAGELEDDE
jgi:uncharacterized membrane protein YtjA (UPF0391 family)